ncbi:PAS domain S-box protein [uncultured Brevundimonas sp.]|uniref:PAS domain S-box protein n=1 Tax=uncultured Brevundimonas sp. TaxID=213418 RepID=UPI0030EB6E45|tara:strand:- start:20316 stop:23417 length:3102 start_codon:yes stop_codon:yes gene_type:complete
MLPALAGVVFLVTLAASTLTHQMGHIAAIWPVNAIGLALILSQGRAATRSLLASVFVGGLLAFLVSGEGLPVSLIYMSANVIEIALVSWLIRRRGGLRLMRWSGLIRFGLAAVIGCAVSLAVAEVGVWLVGAWVSWAELGFRLTAHLLGLLIFAPVLFAIFGRNFPKELGSRQYASWAWLAFLIAVSSAIFFQSSLPLMFVPLAALALVAIRTGFGGAALGTLAVSIIAMIATIAGVGPINLMEGDQALKIMVLQMYLLTLTVLSLTVGSAFAERRNIITHLTRARTIRRQKMARERQLIDHARLAERMSQVGYWTLNPDSGAVFWSPQVYRIHGVEPDSFNPSLGDALAFYVDKDRQRITDLISAGVASGEGWEFDAGLIRRSDGSHRDVRSMAACEKDAAGNVIGFFGVFQDLTDERLAVTTAVEQERRYRLLADNATDVIAVYDVSGVFTYLSPSITELLGYAPEELIGKTPFDIMAPEDRAPIGVKFIEAMKSDTSLTVEYRAIAKDGSVRWLEARPRFQRDDTGRVLEITDAVRDVTERHEREQALAQARAIAEEATRTKGEFLANMSHEIRTPLNGVLGFADVLAQTKLDSDQARYVDRICTAGRGLSALIDDILDFSKIEAGKLTVNRAVFDLRALMTEIVDLTRSAVGDRLVFQVNFPETVAPWIFGDEQRTRQVLLNLLGNAAKFTREGSVTINVTLADDMVEMRVVDTGIGIAPEALARLFEGFTQADSSIGRRFGGTGLGLSISRSLALLMGGGVRLESEQGAGTTAIFSLPYEVAEAPAPVNKPAPVGPARGLRVLAVDDIEANLELIEILLSGAGHGVTCVDSGEAAIATLERDPGFDLVLMDVQMPGMDGLEATRRIRALGGVAARIPIVALTANVLAEQVAACRAVGMDEHLGKPIRREDLFDLIDRVGAVADKATQPAEATAQSDPFAALKDRYRQQMVTFSADLERIEALKEPERSESLSVLSHSIAGTSGSLGFSDVSEAAFALEAATNCTVSGTDEEDDLGRLVQALRNALALA